MPAMMEFEDRKWRDREALKHIIGQWNANRLDLFSLSEPNEEFEFHGVMRFYFQDAGQKIATKCIRVSSTGSTQAVIETLIEKFRPDMKMLHMTEYALYEIHPNGEERCLGVDEKPLLVQLNWHKDDREGRFLLRRADEKSTLPAQQPPEESSFRRKLSKREKRNAKKENKLRKLKSSDNDGGGGQDGENGGKNGTVAEKLYTELPETSFTRSISNPEAVMRRRRQQKLERKLQLFRSKDGGPDTGGTLKIYGESLCRDVPYKTLLLSVRETAAYVVREMLDKYALTREDPTNYCLVQVTGSPPNQQQQQQTGNNNSEPPSEYILEDDECPLSILMNHTPGSGPVMFHVRRRPADSNSQAARRRKKKLSGSGGSQGGGGGNANANSCGSGGGSVHRLTGVGDLSSPDQDPEQRTLPYLVELNPDGSEVRQGNQIRRHFVSPTVTEVGSERPAPPHPSSPISVPSIQLFGPGIHPRHCVLAHTEGMVTLTPCSPQAETYVNGQRLCETTLLQHGCVIRFGRNAYQFRFIDPASEFRTPAASTALNYERFTGQPGGANRAVSTTPSASNLIPVSASAAAAAIVAPPPPPAGPVVVPGTDPILPAVLELPEDVEDAFLHSLIPNLDTRQIVFRLAPTYSLYLMARYRASTHFRPELNPMERAQRLTLTLSRVGAMMQAIVQERYADPPSLAFWMANASELLHFLKSDRHICAFSLDGQDLLAEAVQIAFRNASVCLTAELLQSMPPMLSPPTSQQLAEGQPEQPEEEAATAQVLSVLSSTMGLLRRCRVNAALTIQLFSQLFHALNAALFNRLVGLDSPRLPASASHHLLPPPGANLCSRQWGLALSRRLRRLEAWAERQGLELAADCHLARVMQAAHLLQSPKNTAEQLVETASSCFKLNSLQLRALLERYRPSPQDGEPANAIPPQLIQHIVRVAEGTADELQLADGRPLRLDEDSQLAVPFLLPDDGYSCDVMRGIPTGLMEVLGPLQQAGLCRLTPQPTSSGLWTIYMGEGSTPVVAPQPQQHPIRAPSVAGEAQAYAPQQQQQQQQQPELQLLQLRKASDSMGLSIVAARGTGQQQLGIYIKSVVKGGSADIDGRLQAGDQLLSVDGYSLVGITQDRAAEILMRTSHTVRLEVAKQAAMFHGLATLLSQPSPTSTVSRSTLSLNKMDPVQQQQQRRPPLPQTQQQQQQQQQQAFQERLVDWDRPPTSHRMNSNSSPSLANINDPQQQQQAMGQGRPLQQMAPQLRNANSRSVPALHHNSEPNVGMNQSQDGIHHFQTEQQQQQFYAQQQQQQQQRAMMNQRAMSAQLLSQPRYPNPPQQSTEPTSPTRSTAQQQLQQQQQATRSRSVQNLSAETQQQQQTRASATTLRARHPSDERQYQNIALYQQQQQQQQQQHMQYPGGQGPRPQYAQQLPLPPPPPQQQQQQQQQPRGLLSPVSRTAPGVVVPASVAHLRHPSMAQQQQSSDSPPPPPPPPVSTHPLVAAAAATGQQQQQQSPWEREEKERETAMRRQEAARQWMEEQIEELESLGLGNRTPKQEEQLRALRLEMEFRKRAMEAAEEEDDDDGEASGDRRGMLRLVQEDLERARQWRLEKQQQVQQPMPPPQQQQPPMTNGTNNNNTATVPDQERMRKIEAFQRKQRELEATQAAEERIIREAQRRKEEDIHRHQQMQQHQQQQQQQHWRPTPGANIPIPPPSAMSGGQRLDGVIHQSSSMEMAQHVSSSTSTSSATTSTTTKRVSFFQETTQSSDNKTPTREDPDAFILEAENMLANTPPKTSGSGVMGGGGGSSSIDQLLLTGVSTPGVIGSQEVYRDPRLKRLAEQQQQQKTQLKPGPEKLTFQEKMKMFALESGEQATPKDKSKISKAQREIELKPSPMSEKNSN